MVFWFGCAVLTGRWRHANPLPPSGMRQDLDEDDLPLPHTGWGCARWPSAPPRPEAAVMPDSGPDEVPAAAAALPPALLEFAEPPFWQAPVRWQKPLANTSRIQPNRPSYTHLSRWVWQEGEGDVGIKHRLRSAREPEGTKENRDLQCSLLLWESLSRALWKISSAPGTGQSFNQSQRRPGPRYSQTSVPGAELLATERMNALRQERKRKLQQLWGLLTWKLTRAARAQRYDHGSLRAHGNLKSGGPKHGLHGGYRSRTISSNKTWGTTVQKDYRCNWGIGKRDD